MSRILKSLIFFVGALFFIWAFSDPRFRDAEGFPNGLFCLPISGSMALIIFGWGMAGRFRNVAFWFALALVGQAVALQMIEAGSHIRYQHYKPFYRLFTENHPFILIYLALQTGFVFSGFRTRWSKIHAWFGHNFKVWQLIGIGLVFFLSSATVSKEIFRYVCELFFATFIQLVNLGNIVLMVWDIPEEILKSWKQKIDKFLNKFEKEEISKSAKLDRFVLLAAVWITITAAFLNLFVYERHPHIPDEAIYLYHAKYLANGMLTTPAPPVPDAFEMFLMRIKGGRWYPVTQAGWPAILAIGVILGVPWLINPLLTGLNMILIYLLLQKIYSRYVARLSLLLLCVSPWYVFTGMNFMTEMATLTFALAGALSVCRAKMTRKTKWGWIGGVFIGMDSLIRPLDGLIIAGLLGIWAIGIRGRRLKVSGIVGLILGSIMIGSIVLPYNKFLTGDPTVFPIMAYTNEKFGLNSNAYGFGPERGMGWPIDPFPGHGPIDALVNANLNTFSINIELFGWSTGSLCLIAIFIFSGAFKKEDYVMFATIAAVFIAYFFNYFSGGPDFGARYWFLMIIPLIVLTIRGAQELQKKLEIRAAGSNFNSTRIIVAILSLSLLTLINFFPWRAIDKYHHYRGSRPDIRKLADELNFGKSLVLIRGNSSDYQSAWIYNPIDFRGEAPVYAWDRNWDIRAKLLKAYPERPVWIINGPSITNASFKVVEGPLLNQQLLSERHKR